MRLSLYIDGVRADLSVGGSDALILWTYSREDAESPAAVKNSFTKTVTLPATDTNDTIFNHLYRTDYNTATGGVFDPLARTPFAIHSEAGELLERGYLKLDRVLRRGSGPYGYECTLYGGIGSLFYQLMYNDDGSKRTLVEMRWLDRTDTDDPAHLMGWSYVNDWLPVSSAWNSICGGTSYHELGLPGIVNFAPCHNGVPEGDFDPKLAYYKSATSSPNLDIDGIKTYVAEDGVAYTPDPAANGGIILNLDNRVTEWEAQDFRDYLQRPVVNLARLIKSIVVGSAVGVFDPNPRATEFWKLALDNDDFFNQHHPDWWNTWVTLPRVSADLWLDHYAGIFLQKLLAQSLSPGEYLLGFAKMFGLVFVSNPQTMTVTLMRREKYYANGARDMRELEENNVVDLSGRVSGEAEMRPFLMDGRIYDFSVPVTGTFSENYRQRYGRNYGSFRLDTRYAFDAASIDVMKSLPFNGAADVKESSPFFVFVPGITDTTPPLRPTVKFIKYGNVTYTLYSTSGKTKKMTVDGSVNASGEQRYSIPALPQFHDEAGKPTNGDHVLLYFIGPMDLPTSSRVSTSWHVSHKHSAAIRNFAGGKDLWDISPTSGVEVVTRVPWFRRWWDEQPPLPLGSTGDWSHGYSLDFGDPSEIASGDSYAPDTNVFNRRWKLYLADRYNRDTTVMTVRVDLTGLQVNASLLRRFFWYGNAVWSLNKIIDYDPARGGLTKCEFVRVQSLSAYTGITR